MPSEVTVPLEAWFSDADDGTIIHITGLSEIISYEQSTYADFCDASVESGDLDMVDPLPDDFVGNQSGSISRTPTSFILYLEEWTPSRIAEDPVLAGNGLAILLNRSYISRYEFVNVEQLGTSNGNPNQVFTVSGSTILTPTKGTPIIFLNDSDRWSRVTTFSGSSSTDKVFIYDDTTGTVTFGNGVNGAIPSAGQTVTLKITIKNGGGKWQFLDIIIQSDIKKNLGAIKSVRDKVFYGRCDVACADASKMTSVLSTLNGKIIKIFSAETGDLLAERRVWGIYYGGEINASGGAIILHNTLGSGVVIDKTGVEPPHLLDIDLSVTYPNLRATMDELPSLGVGFGGCPEPGIKEQTRVTKMEGGILTTPKNYLVTMYVYPIVQVVEYIRYGLVYSSTVDGGGGLPCPGPFGIWHFVSLPAYQISFQIQGTQVSSFQLPNSTVSDSDGFPVSQSTRPISARGNGIPALIEIGDQVGDFANPLPPPATPFNNGYNEPDGNLSYTINHTGGTPETFTIPITRYNNCAFQRTVSGSTTSLFTTMPKFKYEVRSTTAVKQYETYMLGAELPDFQCEWTVAQGAIVNYENHIAARMLGFGFSMAGCTVCTENFHSIEDVSFGVGNGYISIYHSSTAEYIRVYDPCIPIFGALDYPASLRLRDVTGSFQADLCACQEVFDVCGEDIC